MAIIIPHSDDSFDEFSVMDSAAGNTHHHHHFHHHYHHRERSDTPSSDTKKTYRVYCKADVNFSLTADGAVFLAPNDPSDPRQRWVKDDRRSALVTDKDGFPSFVLVNKATGQAIMHGSRTPVKLVPYDDGEGIILDGSLLWTAADVEGDDTYKAIRVQNNTVLCMDALKAIEKFGGVQDGTVAGIWEWNGGDNQRWILVPSSSS